MRRHNPLRAKTPDRMTIEERKVFYMKQLQRYTERLQENGPTGAYASNFKGRITFFTRKLNEIREIEGEIIEFEQSAKRVAEYGK